MAVRQVAHSLLDYLRAENQIAFDCPNCGETFNLTQVQLYYIPDRKKDFLAKFRKMVSDWEENKDKLIQNRLKRSRSTIMGQVVEQLRPFLPRMKYEPGDLRSIWKPIDYVCFNGLSLKKDVDSVTFIDVKSGRSHLTEEQFLIKKAVENGHVDFDTIEFKPETLLPRQEVKELTA